MWSPMLSNLKQFSPYLKLLLKVKRHFIFALFFGGIFGITTGFGLPYLIDKVFPTIFGESTLSTYQRFLFILLIPLMFLAALFDPASFISPRAP